MDPFWAPDETAAEERTRQGVISSKETPWLAHQTRHVLLHPYWVGGKKRSFHRHREPPNRQGKTPAIRIGPGPRRISPLPSQTPIADVLTAYVKHIRATKTAKSAQTDIYYLRDAFGPVCER